MVFVGEFGLINLIRKKFKPLRKGVLGIGDDSAILYKDNSNLLITTDALVDGVHFLSRKIDFIDLGYKSIAVNFSDIAAMGGYPLFVLLTIGISDQLSLNRIENFLKGIELIRKVYPFDIIGGDTVRSDTFFISITAIGKAYKKPILRSGAKAGDRIYVSGKIGDSGIGLDIVHNKLKFKVLDRGYFLRRHYKPEPRIKLISYLLSKYVINSCIDISDGLIADLLHICEESKKGFNLKLDRLPVSLEKIKIDKNFSMEDFYEYAASCGEDYELIFTSPSVIDCEDVFKKTGVLVSLVGEITKSGYSVFYNSRRKDWKSLKKGFVHF